MYLLEMVVKEGMKSYIMFLAEFPLGMTKYASVMMAVKKGDRFICSLIINTGHRILVKIGSSDKLEEFFEYEESVRASYEVPSMWGMTTQEWTFEKDPTVPRREKKIASS